ncbi:hypothetical protein [Megalodesulfovibrio paquesii]
MAADFRSQLVVLDAEDPSTRRFDDIQIGGWFILSIQSRPLFDDSPVEPLDPTAGESFSVSLMTQGGVIIHGTWGAWEDLQHKPWASRFSQEFPMLLGAEDVPAAVVQEIYDDLCEYAATHTPPVNKKKGEAA